MKQGLTNLSDQQIELMAEQLWVDFLNNDLSKNQFVRILAVFSLPRL